MIATAVALGACINSAYHLIEERSLWLSLIKAEKPSGYNVRLYYATDRRKTNKQGPAVMYGEESADNLSYGICSVHIPADHVKGSMEEPNWYTFFPDHSKYLEVNEVKEVTGEPLFFSSLKADIQSSPKKEILVFIHGYNVPFVDAARRAAQLDYDLEFKGIPVLYSWPSQGKLIGYMADEASAEVTAFHLKDFLKRLASQSHADRIHIIAHSMGNRALLRSLATLALEEKQRNASNPRFRQIILAAPDIDQRLFENLAKQFSSTAEHVTIYSNSNDKALWLSNFLHTSKQEGQVVAALKAFDVIDASSIKGDFLDHSNFAINRILLADIAAVIQGRFPADSRFGIKKGESGTFSISP